MNDSIESRGTVQIICEHVDGHKDEIVVKNTVLQKGRRAMARALTNNIGDSFQFYVTRMLFGDGGTNDGVKKYVDASRTGLFGVTRLSKPVVSAVDSNVPEIAIFTSVIKFDEIVGVTINEMALQMADTDLYSMTTFADLVKTEDIQLTFNWYIHYV